MNIELQQVIVEALETEYLKEYKDGFRKAVVDAGLDWPDDLIDQRAQKAWCEIRKRQISAGNPILTGKPQLFALHEMYKDGMALPYLHFRQRSPLPDFRTGCV